jgi:hypothetical protein
VSEPLQREEALLVVWATRVVGGAVTLAFVAGWLAERSPAMALAGAGAVSLAALVVAYPPIAAYVLLGATPLIVGINRGASVPMLRPNEALALLVGAALLFRWLGGLAAGRPLRLRATRIDAAIVGLAALGSILPILWLLARGNSIARDDALYALVLWKYYAVFLIVRSSIRTERQVATCLWISLGSAAIVAGIGVLQSLLLFGVPHLLAAYYAPADAARALYNNRGTSTIASSSAVADFMTFNLAIAASWLARGGTPRSLLAGLAGLFVLGALAAGQFVGALGLLVGFAAVGFITHRVGSIGLRALPTAVAASVTLAPVIHRRLSGFHSATGLPPSWTGRYDNLKAYFWPELGSHFNWILGVRPAARVPSPDPSRVWVYIESGYTWLLWTGGIPLLLAFFVYVWAAVRTVTRIARERVDAIGVAACASFAALCVLVVSMIFDPHLTLRGSADLSFPLLALACTDLGRTPRQEGEVS